MLKLGYANAALKDSMPEVKRKKDDSAAKTGSGARGSSWASAYVCHFVLWLE